MKLSLCSKLSLVLSSIRYSTVPVLQRRNMFLLLSRLCSTTNVSTNFLSTSAACKNISSPHDSHRAIQSLTTERLSSNILQSIVFHDDDVIAINKPCGLTVHGHQSSENSDSENSTTPSLVDMLPTLSQHMGIPELKIGLSLKSFYSGLVLLSKSPDSTEMLRKVLSGAVSQKNLFQTYLAIVVGKPHCEMKRKKEMYLERQYLHNREMSVVSDKPVHSARKEGRMIQTVFKLNTISSNESTLSSLVEIKISKDKWDAIPVLLSHYLSPVLGDDIYFSRTNYLMNVPIPAPPHAALPGQQRLPVSTENALWDQFNLESSTLPMFLHRSKVTLPNFPHRSSSTLEITAPPPEDFITALNCLGLRLEENYG